MGNLVNAEYDATEKTLRLDEPLEGVKDHAKVRVKVLSPASESERPWLALKGTLPEENAEELLRLMNEMFPPWNDD